MANRKIEDMLKTPGPLNPEHHVNLGSNRKRTALLLALAKETDLNGVINQALDEFQRTYQKDNPGAWKALQKEYEAYHNKEVKAGKKVKKV